MTTTPKRFFPFLAAEIEEMIWDFSDLVTRHINGRSDLAYLPTPELHKTYITSNLIFGKDLWVVAFEMNWKGDLSLLPIDELPTVREGLWKLESKEMYRDLVRLRPDLAGLQLFKILYMNTPRFGEMEEGSNNEMIAKQYVDDLDDMEAGQHGLYFATNEPYALLDDLLKLSTRIYSIHLWLDMLDPWLFSNLAMLGYIAIYFGHLKLLEYLMTEYGLDPTLYEFSEGYEDKAPVAIAAGNGDLDLMAHLVGMGCYIDDFSLRAAVCNGHMKAFELLADLAHDSYLEKVNVKTAVFNMQLEMTRYLHKRGIPFSPADRHNPSGKPLLELIKFLHEEIGIPCDIDSLCRFAELCNFEVVDYMLSKRETKFEDPDDETTATQGTREFIKHMAASTFVLEDRINDGHVDAVKTYIELFPEPNQFDLEPAAYFDGARN
ncbi:hypothetical protein HDU76_009290, partial [Blyttiomyces sp. JEL0837]